MAFTNLNFDQKGALAVVTINRPKVRNALDAATWTELDSLIDRVRQDKELQGPGVYGRRGQGFCCRC